MPIQYGTPDIRRASLLSVAVALTVFVGGTSTLFGQKAPEPPSQDFHAGQAERTKGLESLVLANAKPAEAARLRAVAVEHFARAKEQFAAAVAEYSGQVKAGTGKTGWLPPEFEWAACARCAQAEMELRLQKAAAARQTVEPFLKDPLGKRSRYRDLALYYHGFAGFLLGDYVAAGRSLNQISSFADPEFGMHARYLLARVFHKSEEYPEAMVHYEGVLADYAAQKKQATEALKQPDALARNPLEKLRLEELVKEVQPDHVGRALFYLGLLYYEAGRFIDARTCFTEFAVQQPRSLLRAQARLFQGCCEVQLRQLADAVTTLQSIVDQEPALRGPALFWLGHAEAGRAEGADDETRRAMLSRAIETLRRAEIAARASGSTNKNSIPARTGRGAILLRLADVHLEAQQPKEAVALLSRVLQDRLMPRREEEILQRRASALSLAGAYSESDSLCDSFQKLYPRSSLLSEVRFRHAQNADLLALAADPSPVLSDNSPEAARLNELAFARYQQVVDRYPEYAHANMARFGLAWTRYRAGDLDKTREILETIPTTDRRDLLDEVPYLLADCLIRLAPIAWNRISARSR